MTEGSTKCLTDRLPTLLTATSLLICLVLLSPPGSDAAAAQRGLRLDRSFGMSGLAMTSPGSVGEGRVGAVSATPDGSPVVADLIEGRFLRLAPDGRPDRKFGNQGTLVLGPSAFGGKGRAFTFSASSVAVDRAGRLLVFGSQTDPTQSVQVPGAVPEQVSSSFAIISRFNREGRLDPSFGDGKGYVREDFGVVSPLSSETPLVGAMSGVADSQNRPVLLAGVTTSAGACARESGFEQVPKALVRLTSAGALDPKFGSDGVSPIDGTTSRPQLQVAGDDQLVVGAGPVGSTRADCRNGDVIYRLGPNGERSIKFGTEGVLALSGMHLAALESSGAVIVSRRRSRTLLLERYSPYGTPQATFGRSGVASITLPPGPVEVSSVLVGRSGGILVVAFSRGKPSKGLPASFLVARLSSHGRLVRGSRAHNWARTDLPLPMELTSAQATLDPRGRLLVAGATDTPDDRDGRFLVARYIVSSK